jgi:enoyl-CoA hydratase
MWSEGGPAGDDLVLARRDGRVGRILLNRPKALNALDLSMVRAVARAAADFRDDPTIHAVVVEGAGGRAFCAGGDIQAIRRNVVNGRPEEAETFFAEEYALNRAIAEYPKPWIALVDGMCMGGGIGLSVHGRACVATEAAVFAMPETAIGLFPDIGATYILPRLPGRLGIYLALTGARMQGADAVHAGFATHFVPRAELPRLSEALAKDGPAVLGAHAVTPPRFSLADQLATIDRCFSAATIPDILERLEAVDSEWARNAVRAMRAGSPSSVFWSLSIVRAGERRTLPECLAAEFALTRSAIRHPDFAEGVRAMLIDKDRHPRWTPATIEDVDPHAIAAMFERSQNG